MFDGALNAAYAFAMAYILVVVTASFFAWALPLADAYRVAHPHVLLAMPLLVLLIWWDRARPQDVLVSRAEVQALRDPSGMPARAIRGAAGIKQIVMTLLAHLVGASVGREAVGLQLGGWAARMRSNRGWYFAACIATGFAIILGTPFAAAAFVFESKRWHLSWADWVGVILLAWLGYQFSLVVGVTHHEYYQFITTLTELKSAGFAKCALVLGILVPTAMLLSFLFLYSVERASHRPVNFRNGFILPLLFLFAVTFLFYWWGAAHVEALGLPSLGIRVLPAVALLEPEQVNFLSHPVLIAFCKVFLTAAFVGIGVRGGEMTPLLASGAMLAVGLGLMFDVPAAGLVSVGFPLLWGIAARRPVAAAILALEIFGFAPWGSLGFLTFTAVWTGIRLGDAFESLISRGRPGLWRRGLYD